MCCECWISDSDTGIRVSEVTTKYKPKSCIKNLWSLVLNFSGVSFVDCDRIFSEDLYIKYAAVKPISKILTTVEIYTQKGTSFWMYPSILPNRKSKLGRLQTNCISNQRAKKRIAIADMF